MAFVITRQFFNGPRYVKRSYDSDNGMWSPWQEKAKTWKTRAGAEAFFNKFISIWRVTGITPTIEEIE